MIELSSPSDTNHSYVVIKSDDNPVDDGLRWKYLPEPVDPNKLPDVDVLSFVCPGIFSTQMVSLTNPCWVDTLEDAYHDSGIPYSGWTADDCFIDNAMLATIEDYN